MLTLCYVGDTVMNSAGVVSVFRVHSLEVMCIMSAVMGKAGCCIFTFEKHKVSC